MCLSSGGLWFIFSLEGVPFEIQYPMRCPLQVVAAHCQEHSAEAGLRAIAERIRIAGA